MTWYQVREYLRVIGEEKARDAVLGGRAAQDVRSVAEQFGRPVDGGSIV